MESVERRYFENGNLMLECPLKDGIRDGACKEYHKSGALRRTSTYRNGLLEGPQDMIHENGQRFCRYVYKNGCVVDGLVPVFYPDGSLYEFEYWENGRCRCYNRNNRLRREFGLLNTSFVGFYREFYEDGRISTEEFYNAGRLDGFGKYWSEDGLKCNVSLYIDGEECGCKKMMYYENGMLQEETEMNGDMPDGVKVCYHENGKMETRIFYENGMARDDESDMYDDDGRIEFKNYWQNNVCKTFVEEDHLFAVSCFYRDKPNGRSVTYLPEGDKEVYYFDGEECESKEDFLEKTFTHLSEKMERSVPKRLNIRASAFEEFYRQQYEEIMKQENAEEEFFNYEELLKRSEGMDTREWICRLAVREFMLRLRLPNDGRTEERVVQNLIKFVKSLCLQ